MHCGIMLQNTQQYDPQTLQDGYHTQVYMARIFSGFQSQVPPGLA